MRFPTIGQSRINLEESAHPRDAETNPRTIQNSDEWRNGKRHNAVVERGDGQVWASMERGT